jgi:hypothetical protein
MPGLGGIRELLEDDDLGNLVDGTVLTHTAFTYHRTWETGLGSEIRVTDFSPDFIFCRNLKKVSPLRGLPLLQRGPRAYALG